MSPNSAQDLINAFFEEEIINDKKKAKRNEKVGKIHKN